ncbi:MAG TPA: hydroxyacid dehydrogenase [Bacteroidetes bacterium]|nr:hydroxyacid dehydrogenase [Bacteroidota bacterium]
MKKKLKVLLTGPIYEGALARLRRKADIQFAPPRATESDLIDLMKQQKIDILIVRRGNISHDVIAAASCLKAIIKHGVGVNNIDIEEARERNIPMFYTPRANSEAVAEHALALMLILAKQIHRFDQKMKATKKWLKGEYQPIEIQGKYLGLIGLGRIGRRLVELVQPFRMKVLTFDPLLSVTDFPPTVQRVELIDKLIATADIISIHCPLTKQTKHMIGPRELSMMKNTALIINTARGGIIDQEALIQALQNQTIRGAGLDTFEQEPLPSNSPLFQLENVVITPHIGGTARESFIRMGEESVQIALKIIEGRINEINPEFRVL